MENYIISNVTEYKIDDETDFIVAGYLYDHLTDDSKFLYYHASVNKDNQLNKNYQLDDNLTKNMVGVCVGSAKIIKKSKLVFNL